MAKLVFSKKQKKEIIQEKADSKQLAKKLMYYKIGIALLTITLLFIIKRG